MLFATLQHSQIRPLTPLSSFQRKEGVPSSHSVGMVMIGVGEGFGDGAENGVASTGGEGLGPEGVVPVRHREGEASAGWITYTTWSLALGALTHRPRRTRAQL